MAITADDVKTAFSSGFDAGYALAQRDNGQKPVAEGTRLKKLKALRKARKVLAAKRNGGTS